MMPGFHKAFFERHSKFIHEFHINARKRIVMALLRFGHYVLKDIMYHSTGTDGGYVGLVWS